MGVRGLAALGDSTCLGGLQLYSGRYDTSR